VSWGNYCGLGDYHCANMWSENIKRLNKTKPEITEVQVEVFGHVCVVTDPRIPDEWRNSFCLTGSGGGTVENLRALLKFCHQSETQWICGCEKDSEVPEIYQTIWTDGPHEASCMKCKRKWEIK
jgi:hypothetical protein